MEMLKFPEFDLERTTTVYNYRLHFSRFLPLTDFALRPEQSSKHYIGQFCFDSWKFLIITQKTCHQVIKIHNAGAAIRNAGHPGRRFLAASPLSGRDPRGFATRFHQIEKPNPQATQATLQQLVIFGP